MQHFLLITLIVAAANAAAPLLQSRTRISAQPDFTQSPAYISPEEVEPRFPRATGSVQRPSYSDDYTGGYTSFLDDYFAHSSAANRQRSQALRQEQQNAEAEDEEFDAASHPEEDAEGDGDDTPNGRQYDQSFHDHEYERIREASKQQEKELAKSDPKHCRVQYKDGMECSVCKNPKTGSHSEQCSFSSTAPAKKYAYTAEQNYNSRDQEDDDDDAEEGEDDEGDSVEEPKKPAAKKPKKQVVIVKKKKSTNAKKSPLTASSSGSAPSSSFRPSQRLRSADWRPILQPHGRFHSSYSAQATERHLNVVAPDAFLYGVRASDELSAKLRKREAATEQEDDAGDAENVGFAFERFFERDFPEAKSAGLIRSEDADEEEDDDAPDAVEFLPDYAGKRNVEKALADFKERDWSACERTVHDELTCYVCHDERGVRHEECMFVAGGGGGDGAAKAAKPSHLSYTETKEYHAKKPTGAQKKSKKSAAKKKQTHARLQLAEQEAEAAAEEGDGNDEDGTNEETIDGRFGRQYEKRSRSQRGQRLRQRRVPDAGEHQAASSRRSIKRATADTADPMAPFSSAMVKTASASYAHAVRHDQ